MQVDPEVRFDRPEQILVPVNFQIGVQTALHENAGAAEINGLLDFGEDRLPGKDVAFLVTRRPVKRTKAAVLGAEIGVIDVPVDDVADNPLRVQFAANGVGGHANSDQIVVAEEVESFLPS